MPTASEAASTEAEVWLDVSRRWSHAAVPELWQDRPPTERAVVVFHDPIDDLRSKGSNWGYQFTFGDLAEVALFAAGLCDTEARAWEDDAPDIATRAYEARRFLIADRLIHWAVPWLDAVGRCYPTYRVAAHSDRDAILQLGDLHRPSPAGTVGEGLVVSGQDSFGPLEWPDTRLDQARSLWSGALMLDATFRSLSGGRLSGMDEFADSDPLASDMSLLFEIASARWTTMAVTHSGSGQLWSDLSERATRTASAWVS